MDRMLRNLKEWLPALLSTFVLICILAVAVSLSFEMERLKEDRQRNQFFVAWLNNDNFKAVLPQERLLVLEQFFTQQLTEKLRSVTNKVQSAMDQNAAIDDGFIKIDNDRSYRTRLDISGTNWTSYVDVKMARVFRNMEDSLSSTLSGNKIPMLFNAFAQQVINDCCGDAPHGIGFNEFSDLLLKWILKSDNMDKRFIEYFPEVRPFRLYFADDKNLIVYPAPRNNFPQLTSFVDRPWFRATIGRHPNYYFNSNSPLTHTYMDVENDGEQDLTVRTFWMSFTKNLQGSSASNRYYILVDFYLDAKVKPEEETPLDKYLFYGSMPVGIVAGLVLFLFITMRVRNRRSNGRRKHWAPKVERLPARRMAGEPTLIRIGSRIETELSTQEKTNMQQGIEVKAKFFALGWERTVTESAGKKNTYIIEISKQYDLSWKSRDRIRAIELWRVVDVEETGATAGLFEVKWNDIVYTPEDIQVEKIYWDANLAGDDVIDEIMQQLSSTLIKSEVESFSALVDLDSPDTHAPLQVPAELGATKLFKKFHREGRDLTKRKLVIGSFDDFVELYMHDVDAVCRIHFLRQLRETGQESLLAYPVRNRIFVESEVNEFGQFFETINEQFQHFLKNMNFRILKFDSNLQEFKHDFAIVNRGDRPIFILFNFDSLGEDAGWVSWREVDRIFYADLYHHIVESGFGRFLTLDEYLEQHNRRSH